MSLVRAALRIATVEALRPSVALPDGPFPTMAGRNVFDSRLDPIQDLQDDERLPVAVVYTEEDNGEPWAQSGPRFYTRTIDCVVEMSVPQIVTEPPDGAPYLALTSTDAELEFALDLFEAQVRAALHFGPSGQWWRLLVELPAVSIHSMPFRDAEEGVRLAMRTLRVKVKARNDDEFDPAPVTAPQGLDRLPDPLKSFIKSLPADHYGRVIATGLAPGAPIAPLRVPFKTMTIAEKVTDQSGNVPAAPNVNASVTNIDS